MDDLLKCVNTVRSNKGLQTLPELPADMRLREDLGFDSLDLAELTARIDAQFGVDVFAEGLVFTVGEIAEKLTERVSAKMVNRSTICPEGVTDAGAHWARKEQT